MKIQDKDKLKGLFNEMKINQPSAGFEQILMQRVLLIDKKKKRISVLKSALAICGCIVSMFGASYLVFYLLDVYFKSEIDPIELQLPQIHIDLQVVSIAVAMLFLLMADTLVRKHIKAKESRK